MKKKMDYYANHSRPATRREFLSMGLTSFAAIAAVPSPWTFVRSLVQESECGGSTKKFIPFLVFDCAGGAALPANFLVGGMGGPKDLLKTYDQLGWNPVVTGIDESFGLPMAKGVSKILAGLVESSSQNARDNLRMGSFCHRAQSDSSENLLSAAGLVAKLGYRGEHLSQSLGIMNSVSGGNSQMGLAPETFRALYLPHIDTLVNAVGVSSQSALSALSKNQLKQLFATGSKISSLQLESSGDSATGALLSKLTTCSYEENGKKAGGLAVDPRLDPVFQAVYQINQESQGNTESVIAAGVVRSVLKGISGPGVITIGDCDYHDGTQTKGDSRDRVIGIHIGRALQAAYELKRPFFFQLITDGGCSNTPGTRLWVSDANEKCMSVIGYFNPTGPAKQRQLQIGHYTEGQGAEPTAVGGMGSNPLKAAACAFANYLSLQTSPSEFSSEFFQHVPSTLFDSTDELQKTLIYET